jgi:hypothetical protein
MQHLFDFYRLLNRGMLENLSAVSGVAYKKSGRRVNPYPIAMAHARLHNWSENRYALHFSFGVGANVKGQDSGGSSPEFLTGLSFSFLPTIYLTGGLDVGKQSRLIGGFKLGDTVPSDITSPPVSSSYKPGFGFAITFTKP